MHACKCRRGKQSPQAATQPTEVRARATKRSGRHMNARTYMYVRTNMASCADSAIRKVGEVINRSKLCLGVFDAMFAYIKTDLLGGTDAFKLYRSI